MLKIKHHETRQQSSEVARGTLIQDLALPPRFQEILKHHTEEHLTGHCRILSIMSNP